MLVYSSNWTVLFPIAVSLFVALRLSQAKHADRKPSASIVALRAFICVMLLFAFLSIGLRVSLLSLVWIGLLGGMALILWWKNRALDRSAMLMTMLAANSDEQRLSIAGEFHHDNVGFVRRRARALHAYLAQGMPWPAALEISGLSMSLYQRLATRLQGRYGVGKRDSPQFVDYFREPLMIELEVERSLGRLAIFSWVLLLIPILTVFFTFISPTLFAMMEEFSIEVPSITNTLWTAGEALPQEVWGVLAGLSLVAILGFMLVVLLMWIFPAMTRLPALRWMVRDYCKTLGLNALAIAAKHEPDLIQACQATSELVPLDFVAERYGRASRLMAGGMKPEDSFLKAGILNRSEAGLAALGSKAADMNWGLQQLAAWSTSRMLLRYSTIIQCLIVALTILLAVIVGAIAASVLHILSAMVLELSKPL